MKKLTKDEKAKLLKEEMKLMIINTTYGKDNLFNLCERIGISSREQYFNNIEEMVPEKDRTINNITHVVKVVHDYGLTFKNGLTLRHINKRVYSLYPSIPINEIRERSPKYSL